MTVEDHCIDHDAWMPSLDEQLIFKMAKTPTSGDTLVMEKLV